jgi:hypothetical protein
MSGLRNRAPPVASASGATGTSKEAGLPQPRQVGEREMRHRALTTLVEAAYYASADVGSIPTVSTRSSKRFLTCTNRPIARGIDPPGHNCQELLNGEYPKCSNAWLGEQIRAILVRSGVIESTTPSGPRPSR